MTDTLQEEAPVFGRGKLAFNGVDGVSGGYWMPQMTSQRLARFLAHGRGKLKEFQELLDAETRKGVEALSAEEADKADRDEACEAAKLRGETVQKKVLIGAPVKGGVDAADLQQAGWAVVFPAQMEARRKQEIKAALEPLLALRRGEGKGGAGRLFRTFDGEWGYQPGEGYDAFCQRQKPEIKPGAADPEQMPFYVLLVGTPEEIPFEFQFELDVMRGVGRLDLGDDYGAYHRYAQAVVQAESGQVKLPPWAAFFGTANPGDKATRTSARWLVQPLVENLRQPKPDGEMPLARQWQVDALVAGRATKERLRGLLGGGQQSPSLLFTASHGVGFRAGHGLQRRHQGALVCQEWGGPDTGINPDQYFAGEDVPKGADLRGMMAMLFACYGAGTPQYDHFAKQAFRARLPIAPANFSAALPQRLLGQGALAVIGHVERAWGYSFVSPGNNLDNQHFRETLRRLMNGQPVGLATDPTFALRYADMSVRLNGHLADLLFADSYKPDAERDAKLVGLWSAANDSRNYVVLGDPAACLPVADLAPEQAERAGAYAPYVPPDGTPAEPEVPAEERPQAVPGAEAPVSPAEEQPPAVPGAEAPSGPKGEERPGAGGEGGGPFAVTVTGGPRGLVISGSLTVRPPGGGSAEGETYEVLEAGESFWTRTKDREEPEEGREDKEAKQSLLDTLKGMAQSVAQAVVDVAKDLAVLEILTYTSTDLAQVRRDKLDKDASLRAITRIKLDGDIEVCVPLDKDGTIDKDLWDLHSDMVEQAQANRAALIKTVIDAATTVAKV